MLKRTEESKLTSWYFEIDRKLLACLLVMFVVGLIWAVSAGSVAAERIGKSWYFFVKKALPFYGIGLVTLFSISLLNKKWILRISVLNVVVGLLLLLWTLINPVKIKGSYRFAVLMGQNIMPSDIMKPGFIMLTAWFLTKMHDVHGLNIFKKDAWRLRWLSWPTYLIVFVPALIIIFRHPDVGTALLYLATFYGMLIIAGLSLWLTGGLIAFGILVGGIAFKTMPHVHARIMTFLHGGGDTYQVDKSIQSMRHGGLLGRGDGSFVKQSLPDAHTDFIFATIVEDIGALGACAVLGLLFYVLTLLKNDARNARDPFVFYATAGAAMLFGSQVCINLLTTLHMMPPKGMTLPLISYGGSSFVSFCLLFGMILAIVREDKWK